MPEIQLSPLEKKLEMLFHQHDIALPRNLRASLCGLIAGEVMQATCGGRPSIRDIKLPPYPQDFEGEIQSRKEGSHV